MLTPDRSMCSWRAANAVSLLRRGKGRLAACRYSEAPHVARALGAALYEQLHEVSEVSHNLVEAMIDLLAYT